MAHWWFNGDLPLPNVEAPTRTSAEPETPCCGLRILNVLRQGFKLNVADSQIGSAKIIKKHENKRRFAWDNWIISICWMIRSDYIVYIYVYIVSSKRIDWHHQNIIQHDDTWRHHHSAPVSMPFTLPEMLQLQETGGSFLRWSNHGVTHGSLNWCPHVSHHPTMIGINGLFYGYLFRWCPIFPSHGTVTNPCNNGNIKYRSMTNYVVVFDKKSKKDNTVTIAFMFLQLS